MIITFFGMHLMNGSILGINSTHV